MSQTYDNDEAEALGDEPSMPGMTEVDFWTACSTNGIVLTIEQMEQFERYHGELLYWNKKVNLISRKDEHNVWERHLLHSLALLKADVFPPKARVLDVGTGGGLPGIPIKIARPDLRMVLVDSIRKKVSCTAMFAEHTGLRDIAVACTRAEDLLYSEHYGGGFDVIISRAVGRIALLMSWVRPLMKPGAVCLFLKGGDLTEEVAEAKQSMRGLDVSVQPITLFGVPWFTQEQKQIVRCKLR